VNTAMNLQIPYNVGKFLSSCTNGGFSKRIWFTSYFIKTATNNISNKEITTRKNWI
jgi:hypothetical protein